jgi:hypothetical protein
MDGNITGGYVQFLEKHLEGDYRCYRRRKYVTHAQLYCTAEKLLFRCFFRLILRLIFLWRNNRIGDMFKKAVEMFPSCAPLLRAFASYCDNGT